MSGWDYVPWLLAGMAIVTLIGINFKVRAAFWCGIAAQFVWLAFDWHIGAYGLMPLALIYGPLYAHGWWMWGRRRG